MEAAGVHREWLAEDPTRYGADVRELLEAGLRVPAHEYEAAVRERPLLTEEVAEAMRGLDAVLLPTTAIVAPHPSDRDVREPLTRFTRPFNTTGQPVVSVPLRTGGLPVGVQVIGHHGRDWELLQVARAVEGAVRGG